MDGLVPQQAPALPAFRPFAVLLQQVHPPLLQLLQGPAPVKFLPLPGVRLIIGQPHSHLLQLPLTGQHPAIAISLPPVGGIPVLVNQLQGHRDGFDLIHHPQPILGKDAVGTAFQAVFLPAQRYGQGKRDLRLVFFSRLLLKLAMDPAALRRPVPAAEAVVDTAGVEQKFAQLTHRQMDAFPHGVSLLPHFLFPFYHEIKAGQCL